MQTTAAGAFGPRPTIPVRGVDARTGVVGAEARAYEGVGNETA
jgi:hypothetical protein